MSDPTTTEETTTTTTTTPAPEQPVGEQLPFGPGDGEPTAAEELDDEEENSEEV